MVVRAKFFLHRPSEMIYKRSSWISAIFLLFAPVGTCRETYLRIKSAYQQMKLRKEEGHSLGTWDESLGVTITSSWSFSPGALSNHVYCSVLSVIVTWYLGKALSAREKVKGKKPQFPPSPANHPPFSWCSGSGSKFKPGSVIHAAEGQVVVETIRWGAKQYPAVTYGRWKPRWKLRSKPLWGYLCSVWFAHYQWMVS